MEVPGKGKILSSHFTFWGCILGPDRCLCAASQPKTTAERSILQKESMHELSIAASIVEAVTESASAYPGARVKEVRLRVGALASSSKIRFSSVGSWPRQIRPLPARSW